MGSMVNVDEQIFALPARSSRRFGSSCEFIGAPFVVPPLGGIERQQFRLKAVLQTEP